MPSGNGTPTPAPSSADCPTSGAVPSSFGSYSGSQDSVRRLPGRGTTSQYVPDQVAITYSTAASTNHIDAAAAGIHATRSADIDFSDRGLRTRVLSVDPANIENAIAQLKSQPGVQSVSRVEYRQSQTIISNDPYYDGFGAPAPLFETSSTPGQWDMHAINVQGGWNDVALNPPVTGAPIAIIDTGVDVTHPELTGGKIIRTECFVTFPTSAAQTTSTFVTDTDGHGTNIAGISDADTDNSLGFASVAFGAPMLAYRIFPSDPSGGCPSGSTNPQCESDTADEASAIMDAVNHGAKVINLSLGAKGPCSTSDPEYTAVEYAISHNVVVVAASGNDGTTSLDCPAADPGVIGVGASALKDSSSPVSEYVASYSNYASGSNGGRYLVAPGGDPSGNTDSDNLHWIENIYSSTAAQKGTCTPDFMSTSSVIDCRIEIAGTSQATPHVAGAASLILAVKPNYTPAQVAAALCASAQSIADPKQGCGRLDVGAAVTYALSH
jgi:subtilisin family serine protease